MKFIHHIKDSLLHYIYPHFCLACGTDVLVEENFVCLQCLQTLPETHFEKMQNNAVEAILSGRINFEHATASYFFTKEGIMQKLMFELKYKSNKKLGHILGKWMGEKLLASPFYKTLDALIPLPLYIAKEKKRGYNQSELLCQGISEVLQIPVLNNAVVRLQHTESQTKKNRLQRWENMEGKFLVSQKEKIKDLHVLLVDDVITTGATVEWCGREILKTENTKLSVAFMCIAKDL